MRKKYSQSFNPMMDGLASFQLNQLFSELKGMQELQEEKVLYQKTKTYTKPCSYNFVTPQPNVQPKKSQLGIIADDDVVICYSRRTALTKSRKGGFNCTHTELMLESLFKDCISHITIDPKDIGDIVIGNVLQPGAGTFSAKIGQIFGDIPYTVPITTLNRFCSSGIEAVAIVAAKIKAGQIECGIAAGMENMSIFEMSGLVPLDKLSMRSFDECPNILLTTGQVAENCAESFKYTRKEQDKFGMESHYKAHMAQKTGKFVAEIVPMNVTYKDIKTGKMIEKIIAEDEGIRVSTMEGLAKLRTPFKENGTVTAGSASQLTDGAAMAFLASRQFANDNGLPIIAKFLHYDVLGVKPELFGRGPAEAIPRVLKKAGITTDDVDLYEINEAFANVTMYAIDKLGLDPEKVNPNGGAIALGHPLACTGARMLATLISELFRQKKKVGIVSMCIGTGMGAAALIEMQEDVHFTGYADIPHTVTKQKASQVFG